MIIFMAGYPFAGKSHVARLLVDQLPYAASIIDPKTYRDDGYHALSEEDKRIQNLSIWDVSLELLNETIKASAGNEITIYDTACASYDKMVPYFNAAKKCGHHVVYVFVKALLDVCAQRAGNEWLSDAVIDKYSRNFEANVQRFNQAAQKCFVLDNSSPDGQPDVSEIVGHIVKFYG